MSDNKVIRITINVDAELISDLTIAEFNLLAEVLEKAVLESIPDLIPRVKEALNGGNPPYSGTISAHPSGWSDNLGKSTLLPGPRLSIPMPEGTKTPKEGKKA